MARGSHLRGREGALLVVRRQLPEHLSPQDAKTAADRLDETGYQYGLDSRLGYSQRMSDIPQV